MGDAENTVSVNSDVMWCRGAGSLVVSHHNTQASEAEAADESTHIPGAHRQALSPDTAPGHGVAFLQRVAPCLPLDRLFCWKKLALYP